MPTAREDLGARLRELRVDAQLDQLQLAQALGLAQPQVSRIENGRRPITEDKVRDWVRHTGASEDAERALVALIEQAGVEINTWRKLHADGWAANQDRYGQRERNATRIRVYQCSLIPGLLQNGTYANYLQRVVFGKSEKEATENVAARLRRQEVLHRPDTHLDVIIAEQVLRVRLGGLALMASALEHVANLSRLPSVDLAVLPVDTDMPENWNESFVLYDMLDPDDSEALVETYAGGEADITDPKKVASLRDLHTKYRRYALTGVAATDFVLSIARERAEQLRRLDTPGEARDQGGENRQTP